MSVVIVNDVKTLYGVLERFFNEYVIEIHRIKHLGLLEYLTSSKGKLYLNIREIFFTGKPTSKFDGKILIDRLYHHSSLKFVLENNALLNSCLVFNISDPENVFYDEQSIGKENSRITVRSVYLKTLLDSTDNTVLRRLIPGSCIKEIVLEKKTDRFEPAGYIELTDECRKRSKLVKTLEEITTNNFSGKINWCINNTKGCLKTTEQTIQTAISLHIVYVANDMEEEDIVMDNVYTFIKQGYRNIEMLMNDDTLRHWLDIKRCKNGSIIVELKTSFKRGNWYELFPYIKLISRIKIDLDIGKFIIPDLSNKRASIIYSFEKF
jgi:hypothetical protein